MINWDAIGAIAETLGAIGVITTLIYLSIQMRQNTSMIQAQMYQARAQGSAERLQHISDSQFLSDLYSSVQLVPGGLDVEALSSLTKEEQHRIRMSELALLRQLDNSYHQFQLGHLPSEFLEELKFTVTNRYKLWQALGLQAVRRESFRKFIQETANGSA